MDSLRNLKLGQEGVIVAAKQGILLEIDQIGLILTLHHWCQLVRSELRTLAVRELAQGLLDCLLSDSELNVGVCPVLITEGGGKQQHAEVQLQGVPPSSIVDSGSEVTIIGGELFQKVAAIAQLWKS